MKQNDALRALAALAHETRLATFRRLVRAGPAGLLPGELAAALDVPPATLSFHLKELAAARLVRAVKEGRNRRYRADFVRMAGLVGYLTENCCADGGSCAPSAC